MRVSRNLALGIFASVVSAVLALAVVPIYIRLLGAAAWAAFNLPYVLPRTCLTHR